MKKCALILLTAVMLLTLLACGETQLPEIDSTDNSRIESASETAVEPIEETDETQTAEPTEPVTVTSRMRDDYLYIGVHHLHSYARTEQHIKELAESGVDYVVEMDQGARSTFRKFQKYGIGVVVTGVIPKWGGGNSGLEKYYPEYVYKTAVNRFRDDPAIWGIYLSDEPSALDFAYMGEMTDLVEKALPNQFVYINLFPNYASGAKNAEDVAKSQLGARNYQQYIDEYCQYIPTDYICFDFYVYGLGGRQSKDDPNEGVSLFYENLRIVSEACRNSGRKMWFIGQVNSASSKKFTSTNQIRFQAFTAMAFGVVNIQWGCYTAGWWHNQILDSEGNKTEQYDKMKTVNWEIHTIAEEYMKYRNVSTHFVGFSPESSEMLRLNQEPIESLSTGVFFDVQADNGAPLVIGQMVSRENDDSYALMICASDDSHDLGNESYNIIFRVGNRTVSAVGGEGEVPVTKLENGYYSVPICSNAGILITAK